MERVPQQPSLRRMRRFHVRPDRDLGQNFLIDSNILGVIERAAELSPDDVARIADAVPALTRLADALRRSTKEVSR